MKGYCDQMCPIMNDGKSGIASTCMSASLKHLYRPS